MTSPPELRLTWEWEAADSVVPPELRATWAYMSIRIGGEDVTLVEDRTTGSSRRSVHVPLYPLAEWIAFNWWFLKSHARPTTSRYARWAKISDHHDSAAHHSLRSVGDGYLWPDLSIVPGGEFVSASWRPDPADLSPLRPIRYLSRGEYLLDPTSVERELSGLVEAVLTRLREQGLTGGKLAEEWASIQAADADEVAFCVASARLGLDPYDISDSFEKAILDASERLSPDILGDLLDSASPSYFTADVNWISLMHHEVTDLTRARRDDQDTVGELRRALSGSRRAYSRPWLKGWGQATIVRGVLGIPPAKRLEPNDYVSQFTQASPDPGLQGLGAVAEGTLPVLATDGRLTENARRFILARGLWHVVAPGESLFLVTSAHTDRLKTERAFAAELLAPAEGIRERIREGLSTLEGLDTIADEYGVSTMVIEHQVQNQLLSQNP